MKKPTPSVAEKVAYGSKSCIDLTASWGRERSGENAHNHRRNLHDPGSCEVPKGQTITLDEWRAQQEDAEVSHNEHPDDDAEAQPDGNPVTRHMVKLVAGGRWQCVDCGAGFDLWPPDSASCPGDGREESS